MLGPAMRGASVDVREGANYSRGLPVSRTALSKMKMLHAVLRDAFAAIGSQNSATNAALTPYGSSLRHWQRVL